MIARRLTLAVLVCACVLVGALALGAGSASAVTTVFGGEGGGAGQFKDPYGVALNQETGDVFVADQYNRRVDRFDSSGSFSLAWGWHVNSESPADELQTCTVFCESGSAGAGAGAYAQEGPHGIAVDNNPLSSSHGDVYVADWENNRVQKFGPNGEFLLMFGWEVNEAGGNVCVAGEHCKAGVEGEKEEGMNENGQFRWSFEGSYIAVGPGGDVYVGDQARVEVFTPAGAWKENIPLSNPEFPGYAQVTALAVDASGDMFIKGQEAPGVRELEPNGTETSTRFDENGSFGIAAVTLDAGGNVYVADVEPSFHVLKYDPTGKQLSSFGAGTVTFPRGMAFADSTGEMYVADAEKSDVKVLAEPPSGPLISGESGTPAPHGEATLEATINPEGHETNYHFEYLTEKQYKEDDETFGAGTVATTAAALVGSEFEEEHVEAKLPEATLVPGETYRWRVVATDSLNQTATGAPQTLEETPSALVDGPWATGVTATSATLAARVDPQGTSTSYRLEYGTSTAYGHVLTGNVGAGSEFVAIGRYIQELAPGTTYHYRIVTSNECYPGKPGEVCTQEGADHTLTTLPAGAAGPALPDGRGWELVTPANTRGARFVPGHQGASDGSAITYQVKGTTLGEGAVSNNSIFPVRIYSRRGPGGWATQDINPPINPPEEGQDQTNAALAAGYFSLFSADLGSDVVNPNGANGTLTSEALEGTPYLRNNANASYAPLLTPANTPPGTILTAEQGIIGVPESQVIVLAGTPDLRDVVLGSPLKLTAEAFPTGKTINQGIGNLYEWVGGRLQLVNILPSGKPTCQVGAGVGCEDQTTVELAGESNNLGSVARVVSNDGRRIAWTRGTPYGNGSGDYKGLYLRDMVEDQTVKLGGQFSRYQTMSSDGSRVFYLEKGDLYVYEAGTAIDLTASHGPGEASAGVQESVSDVSSDGTLVYFVANGVLGDGGEHGAQSGGCQPAAPSSQQTCNLYLSHYNGGTWEAPTFIATLSSEDEHSWHRSGGTPEPDLSRVTSRVSPDGRYLAFMSSRSLTGYDNVDASSVANGAQDEEAFLYDSLAHRLVCVSCDPSGARPHGVLSGGPKPLLADEAWGEHPHWLAGSLPAWEPSGSYGDRVRQPRYLSGSGRLFFNSPEALVPQDTNGFEDVYQYEPPGVGDCAGASATFSPAVGGCVSLISSGQSAGESAFMDASESGDDVFVMTSQRLTAADIDTGYDVWDAHVCSSSAPCLVPPASPPPCSSGDSCKAAPAQQPELFGAGPSETFSGTGNIAPGPILAPKTKALTRRQKLARALAACRKQHKRNRRLACERTAHKRYGHTAKRSHKANTTKRDGK